ncbi:MAG: hypothetical protein II998_11750 [Clostridia bacterium]|nr:hypothetical protein [Clostridia bacterium]
MPFGFFGIDKKKKEEKPPFVPPAPPVQPVYTPPPVQPVFEQPQPVFEQAQPVNVPAWNVMSEATVRICLVSETQELAKDYLCSLKLNADSTLSKGGLAYFSNDPATISETINVKKDIEKCFWGIPDIRWPNYPEEITEEKERIYTFSICMSGYQQKTLDISFCCVSPTMFGADKFVKMSDAVWVINPDTSDRETESEYESMVKQLLLSASGENKAKEYIIIVSQFEKHGCFRDSGSEAELDSQLRKNLYDGCKKIYADTFVNSGITPRICLAQIYGGLEFLERNHMNKPVFYVNAENSCGSYTPEGCQVPILYTIQSLRNSGMRFFADMNGDKIWSGVQNSFSDYIGRKQWETVSL